MPNQFHITLAQLNPVLGHLTENRKKALSAWNVARKAGANLLALPECFLSGYQMQDLVKRPQFLSDVSRALQILADETAAGPALTIGAPFAQGTAIFNGYFLLEHGQVHLVSKKHHLPNFAVFDELRHFTSGPASSPYRVADISVGSPICEDAWFDTVTRSMRDAGAELILVPNGSPYARGKNLLRQTNMAKRTAETNLPLIYLNLVGGQDDQVFDGGSFVLDAKGQRSVSLPEFEEAIETVTFSKNASGWEIITKSLAPKMSQLEQDYRAMVLGLQDYLKKSGFQKALLGLSGGLDSALVALIAADALGPENLRAVRLPSPYTSDHALSDAAELSQAIGCQMDDLPITSALTTVQEALKPHFASHKPDQTEENIQARLRGMLLMALSNKFGEMLLSTGNKSELAIGYATIYGDMAGGYNPIKDLYKTQVYEISKWRNKNHKPWMRGPKGVVIPPNILEKPPSAELRPDQRDTDSLPPYDILDPILEGLIEREASIASLIKDGFDRDTVLHVQNLIFASEYKRFQSAPGPRLSGRAFWLDRRYPIINHWRDNAE